MIRNDIIKELLTKTIICNDCQCKMKLVESPPLHVGDGLGWGCEAFWLCLNDKCEIFVKSFDSVKKHYGKLGGYRNMQLPNENYQSVMMVMSKDAFTGSIIKEVEPDQQELISRLEYGL